VNEEEQEKRRGKGEEKRREYLIAGAAGIPI
jgi:hypothetical protein